MRSYVSAQGEVSDRRGPPRRSGTGLRRVTSANDLPSHIVLVLPFQRRIVAGLTASAVKG